MRAAQLALVLVALSAAAQTRPTAGIVERTSSSKATSRGVSNTSVSITRAHATRGPLDLVPNAAAAYSVARKLSRTYAGPLVRIRRSSDNAEQDFSATAAGVLDTAAVATFIGGGSGFISKLYDQSGNGRDALNGSTNQQPAYTASGINSRASTTYDASNDMMVADAVAAIMGTDVPLSVVTVAKSSTLATTIRALWSFGRSTSGDGYHYAGTTTTPNFVIERRDNASVSRFISAGTPDTITPRIVSHVYTGTVGSLFVSGTQQGADTDMDVGTITPNVFTIGALRRSTIVNFFGGELPELLVYASALSSSDRLAIERNQGTFYGVTVP